MEYMGTPAFVKKIARQWNGKPCKQCFAYSTNSNMSNGEGGRMQDWVQVFIAVSDENKRNSQDKLSRLEKHKKKKILKLKENIRLGKVGKTNIQQETQNNTKQTQDKPPGV